MDSLLPFRYIPTLVLFDIAFVILLSLIPAGLVFLLYKQKPTTSRLVTELGCACALTALSLFVVNGRGGFPHGFAYGWPKEIFTLRYAESGHFHGFYLVMNLAFYFSIFLGLDGVYHLIRRLLKNS